MAFTNELEVKINEKLIEENFDILQITLNKTEGIKASDYKIALTKFLDNELNAKSIYYIFGKTLYALYDKGQVDIDDINKRLNKDNKVIITKFENPFNTNLGNIIYLNLFLNALSNYSSDRYQFNNLTGKLFLVQFDNKPHRVIKTLNAVINWDKNFDDILLSISTKAFKRSNYVNVTGAFKFENGYFIKNNDENAEYVYIEGNYRNSRSSLKYYVYDLDEVKLDRVVGYHKVIKVLNDKFGKYIEVKFKEIFPIGKELKFDNKSKKINSSIIGDNINIINNIDNNDIVLEDGEVDYYIDKLKNILLDKGFSVSLNNKCSKKGINLTINHSKEYYENYNIDDPYQANDKNIINQSLTIENLKDAINNNDENIIEVCLKELNIKKDIKNRKITIDDWEARNYSKTYTFGCLLKGKNNEYDQLICMDVLPNGELRFRKENANLENMELVNSLNENKYYNENNYYISDGDNLNIILRTDKILLPDDIVLEQALKNKTFLDEHFSCVFNINKFIIKDEPYYCVGHTSNMKFSLNTAPHLYNVKVITGENIVFDLLDTMKVPFVHYGQYTVYPYPIKYLREYVNSNCDI